jgi:hypothetical protein
MKRISSQNQENLNQDSHPQNEQCSSQEQARSQNSFQITFQVPDSSDPSKLHTKILQIQQITDCISKGSIVIFVCAPSYQGRKVSVIPTDPLYVLNPIFPGDKKVYFYNGDILNPNLSFTDYGISNGDRIVIVPIEQMNIQTEEFWRKATRNSANDKEGFSGIHDKQSKQLFARKNDLILFKAESRATSNRRLMKNLMFLIDDKSSTYSKTIIPSNSSTDVSTDPLPILW